MIQKTYSFTMHAVDGFVVSSKEANTMNELIQTISSDNILKMGDVPVYEIKLQIKETIFKQRPKMVKKSNTEYTFYVADKIQTALEINRAMFKKYGKTGIHSIPSPVGQPAILTSVTNETSFPTGLHMNDMDYPEPQPVSGAKDIDWHILDEKTDIVLDGKLCQIYPKKTGKYPAFIRDLLQKTK